MILLLLDLDNASARKSNFTLLAPLAKNISMNIVFNGSPEMVAQALTLFDLLLQKDLSNKAGIAVAINNKVVTKAKWNTTTINENDNILVITATQGG